MKPRIAIFLPNLAGGGAEKVLTALAGNFVSRDIDCDIVLVKAGGELMNMVPSGVRVVDLDAHKPRSSILPLARYLRSERPTALLASIPLTIIAALIATKMTRAHDVRTVIRIETRGDLFARSTRTHEPWIDRTLKRCLYRAADATIAVSHDVCNWLVDSRLTSKSRTHVIYNPVIGAKRSAESVRNENVDSSPEVVACGRLIAQKDYPTLLRAFARIRARRECHLSILGEGPMRAALEELARDLGIDRSVSFEGFVPEPMHYMAQASVFVHTSLFEGFGNVLLEALSAGCPIVATDGPGAAREVLGDGRFGVMVPVGDDIAVAAAIEKILDHEIRLPKPGDYLRQFDIETIAEQHLALLIDRE